MNGLIPQDFNVTVRIEEESIIMLALTMYIGLVAWKLFK